MSAADLGVSLVGLPRLVLGMVVFLLPGLAAADRLLPRGRTKVLLAPVFSFTLLPLAAILLNFTVAWKATPGSAVFLALALSVVIGSRRIAGFLRLEPGLVPDKLPPLGRKGWTQVAAITAVALFAGIVHAVPHMTGSTATTSATATTALPQLAHRVGEALQGETYPYAIHVDENTHMAYAAFITRNGTVGDPYTGERVDVGLFSLRGVVHERGFQMGLAELSLLSGASLPVLFLWGPAVWAALLAALAWGLARPHPGALASAAFVAALPTTTLFLGASFLVPIAFGLAWIVATAWVMGRGRGGSRVAAVLLLVSGAFFIHLVAGAACLVVAICAGLMQDGPWRSRFGLASVALLPLAWIGPAVADEVLRQLTERPNYPLGETLFGSFGWLGWVLFVAGAAGALLSHRSHDHRPMAWFAMVVAAVVCGSLLSGHPSLALYYRASHILMLLAAFLAGHAAGLLREAVLRIRVPRLVAGAGVAILVAFAIGNGVAAHLNMAYYRIHDDASWNAGRSLEVAGAKPGEIFLSEPWRAMAYNAVTGATPYTVLRPGAAPIRGGDWEFYLASGGASAAWLHERHITYVVSAIPPKAPHVDLGATVYRVL